MADQRAIVSELYKRIDTLPPDKQSIVRELAKRFDISSGIEHPGPPSAASLIGQEMRMSPLSPREFGKGALEGGKALLHAPLAMGHVLDQPPVSAPPGGFEPSLISYRPSLQNIRNRIQAGLAPAVQNPAFTIGEQAPFFAAGGIPELAGTRIGKSAAAGLGKLPGSGPFRAAIEKWRSLSPVTKTAAARNEYLNAVSRELKKKPFDKLSRAEQTEVVKQADELPEIARREMETAQKPPSSTGRFAPRAQPGPVRKAAAQAREQLAGKPAAQPAKPAGAIPPDETAELAKRQARQTQLKKALPAAGETKAPSGETKAAKPETEAPKTETDTYRKKGQEHGTFIERASIAKDSNIGRYLKSKGYTGAKLDQMSEADWKAAVQEVNKAYGTSYETKTRSIQSLMKRIPEIKYHLKEPAPPAGTAFPKTSEVLMRAPDGTLKPIPADQVEHYRSRGAEVINA